MTTVNLRTRFLGSFGSSRMTDRGAQDGLASDAGTDSVSSPTREVRGIIKWFDQTKGYGFIAPDDGSPDVMLHSSCLRASGVGTPVEGAEITCEAVQRTKGLQAIKVLSLSGAASAQPLRERHEPTHEVSGPMRVLVVKWFSRAKGYGFLQEDGVGEDIFIHMETVRAGGFTELQPGQRLSGSATRGPKGLLATVIAPYRAH